MNTATRYISFFALIAFGRSTEFHSATVPIGFPISWDGDQYQAEPCEAENIPYWLDGYFFCQTSASYGNQSEPLGKKLIHLFDAISAVSQFGFHADATVDYSATYYPTHAYKIWDFFDRDMSRSTVAWDTLFSPVDDTQRQAWSSIKDDHLDFPPNVNFWKVGHSVIAASEAKEIGLQFDVPNLNSFVQATFNDTDEIFSGTAAIKLLQMPVHERMDPENGILWVSYQASDLKSHFYQLVVSITPDGSRKVAGIFQYPGSFDLTHDCDENGTYHGNPDVRSSYMHSITSTEHYVILPLTSMAFNPCGFLKNGSNVPWQNAYPHADNIAPPNSVLSYMNYDQTMPVRFVIFDKRTERFITPQPLKFNQSLFIVHQFNAFELDNNTLVADMTAYAGDAYGTTDDNERIMKSLTTDGEFSTTGGNQLLRFTIDLHDGSVTAKSLIPDKVTLGEFPQFNHLYEGHKYQFGYYTEAVDSANSSVVKINVNDPNVPALRFNPGFDVALSECWFVPTPSSTSEDDGVILVRGINTKLKKSILYVVDAHNMIELGHATAPTLVPFGLHNRYWSRSELGLAPLQPMSTMPTPTQKGSLVDLTTLTAIACFFIAVLMN